jgi:hypothetical protein
MKNRLWFAFWIISLVIIICPAIFFACSCLRTPNPPCRSYWNTPVIFDGIVTEFVAIEDNPNGFENRKAKFKVENTYKGIKTEEVDIYTGDGGSDCGFPFRVGERYLVYAYGDSNYLSTTYCARTANLKNANEDLDYFKQLSLMKEGGLIYGSVKQYAFGYGDDEDFGLTKPISNILIKIQGEKKYSVKTNIEGKFEIKNVPQGRYIIEAVLPKNLEFSVHNPEPIYFTEIENKGCAEAKFYVDFEGEIKGKVLGKSGKPVEGVTAQLVSADYKFESKDDMARLLEWQTTREDGSFRFTGIPPGRYFVGIGIGGARDVFGKEGRVFYLKTDDPKKAFVIDLKEGKKLPEFILQLPEK